MEGNLPLPTKAKLQCNSSSLHEVGADVAKLVILVYAPEKVVHQISITSFIDGVKYLELCQALLLSHHNEWNDLGGFSTTAEFTPHDGSDPAKSGHWCDGSTEGPVS